MDARSFTRLLPILALFLAAPGCNKSDDAGRRADRQRNGLMPLNQPTAENDFLNDQSQVRLASNRNVSFEPLDSFCGAAPAVSHKRSKGPSAPRAKSAHAAAAVQIPPGGSFWQRVGLKTMMGAAAGAPPPAEEEPAEEAAPPEKKEQAEAKPGEQAAGAADEKAEEAKPAEEKPEDQKASDSDREGREGREEQPAEEGRENRGDSGGGREGREGNSEPR